MSAVFTQGNRLEGIIITALGGKKKDVPKPAGPPEPGWYEKAEAEREKREERGRRWVEAHS